MSELNLNVKTEGLHLDPDFCLDDEGLAKLLGVSKYYVAQQRRAGNGPRYIRISPHVIRYRRQDVANWLERQRAVEAA